METASSLDERLCRHGPLLSLSVNWSRVGKSLSSVQTQIKLLCVGQSAAGAFVRDARDIVKIVKTLLKNKCFFSMHSF